jgi:hypothetical protein
MPKGIPFENHNAKTGGIISQRSAYWPSGNHFQITGLSQCVAMIVSCKDISDSTGFKQIEIMPPPVL